MKWLGKSQFFKVTTIELYRGDTPRGIAIEEYGPSIVVFFENGEKTDTLPIRRYQEGVHWIHGWHRKGSKAALALQAANKLVNGELAEW